MIEIDTEEDISMNKTQLKKFAVAARVALIERVKDRARGFGIDEKTCAGGAVIPSKMVQTLGGALLSQTEINQRDALLTRIQSRAALQKDHIAHAGAVHKAEALDGVHPSDRLTCGHGRCGR